MAKWKAGFIAFIITFLMGAMIWFMWNNAIRVYEVIEFIFFIYGFFQAAYWLFCWLMAPSKKTFKETIDPVARLIKLDDGWVNPFKQTAKMFSKADEDV